MTDASGSKKANSVRTPVSDAQGRPEAAEEALVVKPHRPSHDDLDSPEVGGKVEKDRRKRKKEQKEKHKSKKRHKEKRVREDK